MVVKKMWFVVMKSVCSSIVVVNCLGSIWMLFGFSRIINSIFGFIIYWYGSVGKSSLVQMILFRDFIGIFFFIIVSVAEVDGRKVISVVLDF